MLGVAILLFTAIPFPVMPYGGSGWWFWPAAVLSFVFIGLGARVMERLWKPFRDAQKQLRSESPAHEHEPHD